MVCYAVTSRLAQARYDGDWCQYGRFMRPALPAANSIDLIQPSAVIALFSAVLSVPSAFDSI